VTRKVVVDEEQEEIRLGITFVLAVFLFAMCYNLFLLPNNIVNGGLAGLAIVLQKVTGIDSVYFIYIGNFILLFVSYYTLGSKFTKNAIIGSFLFPLMITFTKPITDYLLPYFAFKEFLVTVLMSGLLYGFSNGLIYKCGFSTGGSDVLVNWLSRKYRMPENKVLLYLYAIIICMGIIAFGFQKAIYSVMTLYLSSFIMNKVMFGISDSKVFFVFTKKSHKVEKIILKEFKSGYTVMPTKGGYSHEKGTYIMCVLPNRVYYSFRREIMDIDPDAFFVIMDCYESQGGFRQKNLPFI
jgi:uncharacterized membrane-anchored protein YitT (DUF2179 family)